MCGIGCFVEMLKLPALKLSEQGLLPPHHMCRKCEAKFMIGAESDEVGWSARGRVWRLVGEGSAKAK